MKASEIIKEYDMHYDAKTKHYTHTSERTKEVLSELIEINDNACLFMRGDAFYDGVTYTTVVENDLKDYKEEDMTLEILKKANELKEEIEHIENLESGLANGYVTVKAFGKDYGLPEEVQKDLWDSVIRYRKKIQKEFEELK